MLALFPEILHVVATGDLETLACLVRKYFADRQIYSPRLRVEPLMINAGLILSRDDIADAARLLAADHRGAWHVSIVLSPGMRDAGEMNFTLAHLFGHFLCDIQPLMAKGELQTREHRERTGALARYLKRPLSAPEELQADAFANALLMPRGMVKKAYGTLGTIKDTAAFFNVRLELMEQRLSQLDLLPRSTPKAAPTRPEEKVSSAPEQPKVQAEAAAAKAKTPIAQSSLVKAQKSVAAFNYRREEQLKESKPQQRPEEKSAPREQTPPKSGEGMRRLREIARKIDKSVDP